MTAWAKLNTDIFIMPFCKLVWVQILILTWKKTERVKNREKFFARNKFKKNLRDKNCIMTLKYAADLT